MKCNKCHIDKPLNCFYTKDNEKYRKICKDCTKEQNRIYREKNRERINERKKIYRNAKSNFNSWSTKLKDFEEIRFDPEDHNLLQVKCIYCGKWYNPTNEEVSNRLKFFNGKGMTRSNGNPRPHGEGRFYCSDSCKKACPIFQKVKYPEGFQPISSKEVNSEFRKIIFEKDNYTCQKCGTSKLIDPFLELHCHHIYPKALNPLEECDPDNGLTLCKNCHKWIHLNISGCGYSEICKTI